MSTTSWVCAQIWSRAGRLGWGLRLLAATWEEVAVVVRNGNWAFWHLFFVGDSLRGQGLEREKQELGLPHQAVVSWRFQAKSAKENLTFLFTDN